MKNEIKRIGQDAVYRVIMQSGTPEQRQHAVAVRQQTLQGRSSQQYDLATIWNSNSVPVVRKQPESPIDYVQQVVEDFYYEFGIELESQQVSYYTDEKGKDYTAVTFTSDTDMFSQVGSQANQQAKQFLSQQLKREVNIGGERYRVIVWIH